MLIYDSVCLLNINLHKLGIYFHFLVGQIPQSFLMMQLMNNMNAGQGTAGNSQGGNTQGGNSQGENAQSNYMNNALLCRNTRNLAFVPCANFPDICNIISMRTYTMPNLLTCSALGTGCCLRDMATMFLARNM